MPPLADSDRQEAPMSEHATETRGFQAEVSRL
ncbi:MAG: hypothetical protein HW417_1648, partial [Steroidobacteraceae bacterium]|nr:hypothetical protein [Steroidobacteraceae bacterium]